MFRNYGGHLFVSFCSKGSIKCTFILCRGLFILNVCRLWYRIPIPVYNSGTFLSSVDFQVQHVLKGCSPRIGLSMFLTGFV